MVLTLNDPQEDFGDLWGILGSFFIPLYNGANSYFSTSGGLHSFEHPLNKLMPMLRVDSDGQMCGANLKVDVCAKKQTNMPRVGSEANWANQF